jgi:hypothetical protein
MGRGHFQLQYGFAVCVFARKPPLIIPSADVHAKTQRRKAYGQPTIKAPLGIQQTLLTF